MSEDEKVFAFSTPKLGPNTVLAQPNLSEAPAKKTALVLDMGKGSREQGFRQNGCR